MPSPLRLSAFTLRNVLTAGDTPVRIEFGRRLTLMYGENGVGKSGYHKVLNVLFNASSEHPWDKRHWYAVPQLRKFFRHNVRTDATAEVTFEYETLDGKPVDVHRICLRWPAYVEPEEDELGMTPDPPSPEAIATMLRSSAREIDVIYGDGTVHRVLIYHPWTMTDEGPTTVDTHHVVRALAEGDSYTLHTAPWTEWEPAIHPRITIEGGDESLLDLVRLVYTTISEHAAPPFHVRRDIEPEYLSRENAGEDLWPFAPILLERTWQLAAPSAPWLDIDYDFDDEDAAEDNVRWVNPNDLTTFPLLALSSGEQRIYTLLSHIVQWYALVTNDALSKNYSRHTCLLEEPETHLHPRAQGHLLRALLAIPEVALSTLEELRDARIEEGERADEQEEALARLMAPAFVLETHSEAFLRAVQSALRTGALQPDDLRVNVFNRDMDTFLPGVSQAMFGADGNLHHMWPGVFPSGDAGEPS